MPRVLVHGTPRGGRMTVTIDDFDDFNPHWPQPPAWFTTAASTALASWLRDELTSCGHDADTPFIDTGRAALLCGACMVQHVAHHMVLKGAATPSAPRALAGQSCGACNERATRLPYTLFRRLDVFVVIGACDRHGQADA